MRSNHFLSERQQRLAVIFTVVLLALSFLLIVAVKSGATVVVHIPVTLQSQGTIKGSWTTQVSSKRPDQVQITFSRSSDKGDYNNTMGESFSLTELQGLNGADAATSSRSSVAFSLVREAGTVQCEGSFSQGRGAGFWTFTPNASFVSSMNSRGYTNLDDEDLLRAAFHNLTSKYIDELKSAGYDKLTFDQVVRAAGHEITTAYIRELRDAGFTNLTMDDIIRASNHEIDSKYVAQVGAMGFGKQSLDDVIRLRNHEIDQPYIEQMKSAGFSGLSADELIRLKNHEVTPEFVSDIKAEGYSTITADQAIRLKSHDIDRDFIRHAKSQGYPNATLDDIIRLSSRGTIK